MSVLKKLLFQITDYAGLFPPAALPLAAVIKNYEKYVPGDYHWMLARLIIPSGKLSEFAKLYQQLFPGGLDHQAWKISALIPPIDAGENAFSNAMESIESFNQDHKFAQVDTVEGRLPTADLIDSTVSALSESLSAFLEIPFAAPNQTIEKLAATGRPHTFAKIRTGGVEAELIPSSEQVANFIASCARENLGFKATAGLHHPLRGEFPLTYQTDSPRGTMHGFINVFTAACLARHHGWTSEQLVSVLESRDPDFLVISDDQISVDGQVITASEIESTRNDFAISFGSCSFMEPIDDLIRLGWLADAAKPV